MVSLTEQVLSAIETLRNSPGSLNDPTPEEVRGECYFFDNFNMNLPYGVRRKFTEQQGWLDNPRYSRSGRTLREFDSDIDQAIQEEGIDMEQIERLQQEGKQDLRSRGELFKLMIPVYIKLRNMGYSHADLCN